MSRATYTQNFDLGDDWRLALRSIANEMERLQGEIAQRARANVPATFGTTRSAIGFEPPDFSDDRIRGVIGVDRAKAAHGWALEAGLKPGKWRPIEDLLPWVEKEIGLSGEEAVAAAYAVQKKIHDRGTQGAFFMRDAFAAVRGEIEDRLVRAIDTVM